MLPSRNDVLGFAERTRRNLEYIEEVKAEDPTAPVHVVTQLTLSLLGLIVFPYHWLPKDTKNAILDKPIAEMETEGWLGWSIKLDARDDTITLDKLLGHLRNAVAHGRMRFTSDSPSLEKVVVKVEDKPLNEGAAINWRAEIHGPRLREFCVGFLNFLYKVVS